MNEVITDIVFEPSKWQEVEDFLQKRFGRVPDLQAITYIIGHRELGLNITEFTKEEKEELMHVGVCALLSQAGYYEFVRRDEDGWPHFERNPEAPKLSGEKQDLLIKMMIIEYFEKL